MKLKCPPGVKSLLHDQLIQTGSQEIWLVQSRSVNPHTAREIPYSPGCPAPMFAESVHRVNTTNKFKQCGSWKALLSLGLRISCSFKNEEDVWWKTSRGWVSQLDVVSYLFWYDPFYHGNFKFKAKLDLGLDAVLHAHFQLSFRF